MELDVAIIGCGVGGLYALKHCLEAGLRAAAFDRAEHLGGVCAARRPSSGPARRPRDPRNGPGCVTQATHSVERGGRRERPGGGQEIPAVQCFGHVGLP